MSSSCFLPYFYWVQYPNPSIEFYQILVIGQSNALGVASYDLLSKENDKNLKMFTGGITPEGTVLNLNALTSLSEQSGNNTFGETICSSVGSYLNYFHSGTYLFSVSAGNGFRYDQLKSGTAPFSDSLSQIRSGKAIADSLGLNYKFLGICSIHGETDQGFSDTGYQQYINQWYSDYNHNVKNITSQTEDINFYACQQAGEGSAPSAVNAVNFTASSSLLLYYAHTGNNKVIIPTSRYIFDHSDGIHLTAWSQRHLGQYYAKAIKETFFDQNLYKHLEPTGASLISGNKIKLDFYTPAPPIQFRFDRTVYQPNYGFRYADSTNSTDISGVDILSSTSVLITLSGAPTGINKEIRYACDTHVESWPKFGNGNGNLSDSYSGYSSYGLPMENYCLTFRRFI